jgi:hypothetical protein
MNDVARISGRPVIRKAERRKSKLRLALVGPTGSGKSFSALQLAFGLGTKVGMVDTEHGSGDLYADLGDYDVITLEPPYSVAKYRDAIRAFEDSPAHIIATMRTKTEYVVEKDDRGKNSVRKLGLSPVQRDGVEYEFTLVMDVTENHFARASKDRTSLFDGWSDRIGRQTGKMLRQWLDTGADAARAMPARMAPAPVVRGDWPDDSMPDAWEDEPWPGSEPAASPAREAINRAVPLRQPKPTISEWLDQFAAKLAACETLEQVEAAILCEEACRASTTFTGDARTQLKALIADAIARHPDAGDR